MNKSAAYTEFEEGFLKEAAHEGCDIVFLRGLIKEADTMVSDWKAAFDELATESGDPLFRTKLAGEIYYFTQVEPEMLKQAGLNDFLGGMTNQMNLGGANDWIMKMMPFLKSNPNFLSSLITGGGGGGLIGLLLGALTGHPMAGMMLGGLGGAAGMGAYNQGAFKDMIDGSGNETAQLDNQGPSQVGANIQANEADKSSPEGMTDIANIDKLHMGAVGNNPLPEPGAATPATPPAGPVAPPPVVPPTPPIGAPPAPPIGKPPINPAYHESLSAPKMGPPMIKPASLYLTDILKESNEIGFGATPAAGGAKGMAYPEVAPVAPTAPANGMNGAMMGMGMQGMQQTAPTAGPGGMMLPQMGQQAPAFTMGPVPKAAPEL